MTEDVLSSPAVVGALLQEGVRRLESAEVSNAAWEAREMMGVVLSDLPTLVPLRTRESLTVAQRTLWNNLLDERCSRKPLAQVLGEWDFAGLRLSVTPDVLVPRPETEEFLARQRTHRVHDGDSIPSPDVNPVIATRNPELQHFQAAARQLKTKFVLALVGSAVMLCLPANSNLSRVASDQLAFQHLEFELAAATH